MRIGERIYKEVKKGKIRLLIIAVCLFSLALYSFIKTSYPPAPEQGSFQERGQFLESREALQGLGGQRSTSPNGEIVPPLIKTHLLANNGRSANGAAQEEKAFRNIFMPVLPPPPPSVNPAPPKPVEVVKPVIDVKLVGIIENRAEPPAAGLVRHAILSAGGEIIIAGKGDVVNGQYEVTAIEADSVEIRIVDSGHTEKLIME